MLVLAYAYTRGENFDIRLPRVCVREGGGFLWWCIVFCGNGGIERARGGENVA